MRPEQHSPCPAPRAGPAARLERGDIGESRLADTMLQSPCVIASQAAQLPGARGEKVTFLSAGVGRRGFRRLFAPHHARMRVAVAPISDCTAPGEAGGKPAADRIVRFNCQGRQQVMKRCSVLLTLALAAALVAASPAQAQKVVTI